MLLQVLFADLRLMNCGVVKYQYCGCFPVLIFSIQLSDKHFHEIDEGCRGGRASNLTPPVFSSGGNSWDESNVIPPSQIRHHGQLKYQLLQPTFGQLWSSCYKRLLRLYHAVNAAVLRDFHFGWTLLKIKNKRVLLTAASTFASTKREKHQQWAAQTGDG